MLSLKEYLTLLVPTTFQPASDLTMAGQTEMEKIQEKLQHSSSEKQQEPWKN